MILKQRTVLITGGTDGIGFEFARELAARGNTVIVTGRDARKLAKVKAAPYALHAIESDVSKEADIMDLRAFVEKEFGSLDVLINNAGLMRNLDLSKKRELADISREVDVMLRAPIQMVQAFLSILKQSPEALIVNITSGLALVPFPLSPVYSAAKAGLRAYTKCLRVQLIGTNVSVVDLAPPGVETKLFRNEFEAEMQSTKAMPTKTLVAKAITGIESGQDEIRPGLSQVLYVLSRLAPSVPFRQMAKMVPRAR